MHGMKLGITLMAIISTSTSLAKTPITLGFFELPPFAYTEGSEAKGVAIDYIKELFKDSKKYSVQFKHYPFQRMLMELEKSRIHGAVLLGKNKEREKIYQYPSAPYISDRPAIVFKKGNAPKSIQSIDDIKDFSLGIPQKAYISPFISKNKTELKIKYIPSGIDHLEPMMLSLAKSRGIQALYLPTRSTLISTGKKLRINEKLSIRNTPEKADIFYTVFSKKVNQEIIDFYNQRNKNFISDEKLSDIILK